MTGRWLRDHVQQMLGGPVHLVFDHWKKLGGLCPFLDNMSPSKNTQIPCSFRLLQKSHRMFQRVDNHLPIVLWHTAMLTWGLNGTTKGWSVWGFNHPRVRGLPQTIGTLGTPKSCIQPSRTQLGYPPMSPIGTWGNTLRLRPCSRRLKLPWEEGQPGCDFWDVNWAVVTTILLVQW